MEDNYFLNLFKGKLVKLTIRKLPLSTSYFGVVHRINANKTLVLADVVNGSNGCPIPGTKVFFANEILNVELVNETSSGDNGDTDAGKDLPNLEAISEGDEDKEDHVPFVVIDNFQEKFGGAVIHIKQQCVIGVGAGGLKMSEHGRLCWLQIATKKRVYLFDILLLGSMAFRNGISSILESKEILKVLHDCREIAGFLMGQFGVKLNNVFDTQVADLMCFHSATGGFFPDTVSSLEQALSSHLQVPSSHLLALQTQSQLTQEDAAVWRLRPCPLAVLRLMAVSVVHLQALRLVLMDNLMMDYMKMMESYLNNSSYNPAKPGRHVRENHKDYNQVVLDVRRSMKRFPERMPAADRGVLQEQLIDIILEVLKRNPQLHYYQGYHDVAVSLLLVVGERMAIAMLETLSNHHLRDFMDPTMDSTKHILNYLMPILEQVDAELYDFMIRAEVGTIFALSWLITWFGHVLSESKHTLRLYDFFLSSHPLMPIYLAAAIVLHREKEVKQTECDMAMVHHLLSRIPQDLPYELLICQARDLFDQYPPSLLAKQAALQSHKSLSISTFQAFQLSTLHQRPDFVLQRLTKAHMATTSGHGLEAALSRDRGQLWGKGNRMVKMAVWGLSATLGAAMLAVAQTAMEWGPDVLLQLF